MVENEELFMAFSTTDSPVYGGSTISLEIPEEANVSPPLYFVYEGSNQRHITLGHLNQGRVESIIPEHDFEEQLQLNLCGYHEDTLCILATSPFQFYNDSTYHLAWFLLNSVYNSTALDDLELIRSENFDLSNEVLDTLDDRLYSALTHLEVQIPEYWTVLGDSKTSDITQPGDKSTLLHFTAQLGLYKVATFFLDKPGGDIALKTPNRHGYLPHEIATEHEHHELTELLNEFNQNFVHVDRRPIFHRHGIIHVGGNNEFCLTTYLQKPIADDIHLLQQFVDNMSQDTNSLFHSQTDWPETKPEHKGTAAHEDTKYNAIIQKSRDIHVAMETIGDFDNPETADPQQGDDSYETLAYGTNNNLEDTAGYEGSLADLHGFNQQIFRLREYQRNKLVQQDVRKDSLSRYSSSCPALRSPDSESLSTINLNEGHHNSMHNLAKDEEQSVQVEESVTEVPTPDIQIISEDESGVQICVNGITHHSSDDIKLDTSLNKFIKDYYGDNLPGVRRRSSWCPQTTIEVDDLRNKYVNQSNFSQGKSASLNQLDGNDTDDDDDSFHDAKEDKSSPHRQNPVDMDALSISPSESGCSSPFYKDVSDDRSFERAGESLIGTLYHLQQEMVSPRDKKKSQVRNLSEEINQSGDSEEEFTKLTVPQHSSMTKAQSTPSIPQAVSSGDKIGHSRDPKQPHHCSYLNIQKIIAEHDAQFRRQAEIEEDDDENTNRMLGQEDRNKKSKLSLLDFLNDSSYMNEDQKSGKKEEKKRKTSVFSRFSNSYRTKKISPLCKESKIPRKHKDKDAKGKNTHQFVSVSVSNSTPCVVCNKSMANKLALRCENCLINVHESSCKDQVTPCGRLSGPLSTQSMKKRATYSPKQHWRSSFYKRIKKLPPRENNEHKLLKEKQLSASSVTGLRHTQSFKDNRSSSAPSRSQAPQVIHRLSLPPSSLTSQLVQAGYIPWRKAHKFHDIDKPIDEDLEQEHFRGVLLQGSSTDGPPEFTESSDDIDGHSDTSVQITDDFLTVYKEEPEHWSLTVDKKVLKKMNAKDIKRQDTIWELIQTERHHCRTLKILQKVYSEGILQELLMPPETVEKLFPKLDELIEIHMTFLNNLQELQNRRTDHSVEFIGDTLVNQFGNVSVDHWKKCYGKFCANQKEAVQFYKDLLIKDRKFVYFIQKCGKHSLCKKRDIPAFLLLVTQRPTKYPILIEHILKRTNDKKDRENLSQALQLSKDLLEGIDEYVDAYELKRRLKEIYDKLDPKSSATYRNRKFKRSDIYANNRSLVYDGPVLMRSARGKHTEVICVVLTDLIFFIQDVNGRYNFYSQDDKSCVIPLFELLVREKSDTRDSRGIYLISHKGKNPEMYEIVCNSNSDRQKWIPILQKAASNCPPDSANVDEDDAMREEMRRVTEARSAKVNNIIDQLHCKDNEIKQLCDQKNELMVELLNIYSGREENKSRRPGSIEDEGTENIEALQAALQDVSVTASQLTTMLQGNNGNGSQLSRHVSSVGEHFSSGYSAPPVPKRAETFAGFDSQYDVPKASVPKKKTLTEDSELEVQSSTSLQNLDRAVDSDSELHQLADVSVTSDKQQVEQDDSMDSSKHYDRYSSDTGSFGDVSGSSTYSTWVSSDHYHSINHLSRSLQSIVHLTQKQVTAVESLRAQLAEANEKINNLSAEVHDRKGGLRHNQLEELRNLQEQIRRERQSLEKEKERERMVMEHERTSLEEERKEIERKESELQNQREDFKKKKEMLQRQQDLWEEAHREASKTSGTMEPETHADTGRSSPAFVKHRRSASEDFCSLIESDMENLRQGHLKTSRRGMDVTRSDSRASIPNASFTSSANRQGLPIHLISAKNETKAKLNNPQQIPTKLSGQGSSSSLSGISQKLPFKLSTSNSAGALPSAAATSSGVQHNASSSSLNQKSYTSNKAVPNSKQSPTSMLTGVMKLAQPGGKGKPQAPTDNKQGSPKPDQKGGKSDGVIYF